MTATPTDSPVALALTRERQRLAAAQQEIARLTAEIEERAQRRQAVATDAVLAQGAIVALEALIQ